MRLVLASQSPARLQTLRRAGLDPVVIVSGVDEDAVSAPTPTELATSLAELKGLAVLAELDEADVIVLACDSVLEFAGAAHGKPGSVGAAAARWRELSGRTGVLHTGHWVAVQRGGRVRTDVRLASTTVHFADLTDTEIEAYAATGEPEAVAGAFTIDGYGAAFITGIEGDPHNVVGISVPLLRTMLASLGISWPSLWVRSSPSTGGAGE